MAKKHHAIPLYLDGHHFLLGMRYEPIRTLRAWLYDKLEDSIVKQTREENSVERMTLKEKVSLAPLQ